MAHPAYGFSGRLEQVALYQTLCYPPAETIEQLAEDVVTGLHSVFGPLREWELLDFGSGAGWVTRRIVSKLIERGGKVSLTGVEPNAAMIELCIHNLQTEFPSLHRVETADNGDSAVQVWADEDHGFRAELHSPQSYELWRPPARGRYHACFLFFCLHRMAHSWRTVLGQLDRWLQNPGVVANLELDGDIASWCRHFEEVELFAPDLGVNDRLRFLRFIREFQDACENFGWNNTTAMSLSDISAALEYQHELGFRDVVVAIRPYKSQFTMRQWLRTAGMEFDAERLKSSIDGPMFSAFPDPRRDLNQPGQYFRRLERAAEDCGLGPNAQDEKITGLNSTTLHLMKRVSGHHVAPEQEPQPHAEQEVRRYLRSRFSELRVPPKGNQIPVEYSANDLESIWESRVVDSPVCMMTLHWDLENETWQRDTAVMVRSQRYLEGLVRYFAGCKAFTQGYSISNTVFRGFPESSAIRTVHGVEKFDIKFRLHPSGSVAVTEFYLPSDVLRTEELNVGMNVASALRPSTRLPDAFHVRNSDLQEEISRLAAKFQGLNPFDEKRIAEIKQETVYKLQCLVDYTGNDGWLLRSGNDLENFLKTLFLTALCEGEKLWHLPSRDTMRKGAGASWEEKSAGGMVVVLEKRDSRIDTEVLTDCLNLRNRALYLRQHQDRTVALAVQAAEAAVISRNMSHNIGSHVLAGLAPRDLEGTGTEGILNLASYLQQRMDFVARLATRWPAWREAMLFWADLFRPLCQQELLLDRLLADCGYGPKNMAFFVRTDSNKWWKVTFGKEPGLAPCGHDEAFVDFPVSLPGGMVGKQAFYGFIENAVRNAAKHNLRQAQLNVYLSIFHNNRNGEAQSERRFTMEFHDSLTRERDLNNKTTLSARLSASLQSALVREDGSLNPEGWGLQEMKTYAKFLSYEGDEKLRGERGGGHDLLTLAPAPPEEFPEAGGTANLLGFRFYLQRSTIALIVPNIRCSEGRDEALSNRGVCLLHSPWAGEESSPDQILRLIHQRSPDLLAIEAPETGERMNHLAGWLCAPGQQERLPARVLLYSRGRVQIDAQLSEKPEWKLLLGSGRLQIAEDVSWDVEHDNADRLIVAFYWSRLKELARARGFALPICVAVGLNRPTPGELLRWDPLLRSVAEHGLDKFIHVYRVLIPGEEAPADLPRGILLADAEIDFASEEDRSGSWMVFDNHGKLNALIPSETRRVFQQLVGHDEGTGANNQSVFEHLFNPPEELAGVLYLLQLIESGMMRILIVDERVGQRLYRHREIGGRTRLIQAEDRPVIPLMDANIEAVPVVHLPTGNSIAMLNLPHGVTLSALETGLFIGDNGVEKLVTYDIGFRPKQTPLALNENAVPPYDVVIVHLQQLQNIQTILQEKFNEFLKSLHSVATRVLITSGRGAARSAPFTEYPFIEYSALEQYLVRELSKVSLCNIVSSVKCDIGID